MGVPLAKRFKVIMAVYVIFRDDNDRVLLLRRANTGYFDGSYSLPAGHVEGREPAIEAAAREALEEVGAVLQKGELEFAHIMHRVSDIPEIHERIDLYFQTIKPHPEITNKEPHKCDELRWVPLTSLPENMSPEVKVVLQKVAAGELYSNYQFEMFI